MMFIVISTIFSLSQSAKLGATGPTSTQNVLNPKSRLTNKPVTRKPFRAGGQTSVRLYCGCYTDSIQPPYVSPDPEITEPRISNKPYLKKKPSLEISQKKKVNEMKCMPRVDVPRPQNTGDDTLTTRITAAVKSDILRSGNVEGALLDRLELPSFRENCECPINGSPNGSTDGDTGSIDSAGSPCSSGVSPTDYQLTSSSHHLQGDSTPEIVSFMSLKEPQSALNINTYDDIKPAENIGPMCGSDDDENDDDGLAVLNIGPMGVLQNDEDDDDDWPVINIVLIGGSEDDDLTSQLECDLNKIEAEYAKLSEEILNSNGNISQSENSICSQNQGKGFDFVEADKMTLEIDRSIEDDKKKLK